eukprot:scaffold1849_cov115-Cylindrotheca_fusiformis.AAC.6
MPSKTNGITQLSTNSSSGGGSETKSGSESAPRQIYIPPTIAKREEANVRRSRVLLALILLLAVAGTGAAINLLVKQQEHSNFETKVSLIATISAVFIQ